LAKCIATLKACQGSGERQNYAFNLTREFSRLWEPDVPYSIGIKVRPNIGTGFEYTSSGGVSNGIAEPAWPATGTVEDGSITWTAGDVSNDGLRHRIDTVQWSAPSDIEIGSQLDTDEPGLQEALIWVGPGGMSGVTYDIDGEITTDTGAVYQVRIELKIA
jgi:hypothetical protein